MKRPCISTCSGDALCKHVRLRASKREKKERETERIIRAEDAFLHPNITAGSELLFSLSHHNSFILTALRRRRVRTNLHLSSSDGALCVFVHICICTAFHFTLAVSDLAPLPPARLSCIRPSLNPHSLQLVTHPLFCIFSLDVAVQLTHASSQAEHHCEQRSPAAGVGANQRARVCVCVICPAMSSETTAKLAQFVRSREVEALRTTPPLPSR